MESKNGFFVPVFALTSDDLHQRLRRPPSLGEAAAMAFAITVLGFWATLSLNKQTVTFYDLLNFLGAARGDFSHYYYMYWGLPLFAALARLPQTAAFMLLGLINIAGTLFACRVTGSRVAAVLISLHAVYWLSQGQIVGLVVAGWAFLLAMLVTQHWYWAGWGLVFALLKPQMGLLPSLALLGLWQTSWKNKLKPWLWVAMAVGATFLWMPDWPQRWLLTIHTAPPYAHGNVTLWPVLGGWTLLLWVPLLFYWKRLSRNARFLTVVTLNILAVPYFQQTDLLLFLVLLSGWWALTSNLPWLATLAATAQGMPGWPWLRQSGLLAAAGYVVALVQGRRRHEP